MRRQHTVENKEPREQEVSPADVVAFLAKQPQPASIRQIAHGMDLKHAGRRYLPRVIKQLTRSGDIEETYGGRYRVPEEKRPLRPRVAAAPSERRKPAEHLARSPPLRRRTFVRAIRI